MSPNKHMQRAGMDEVLGRGRGHATLAQAGRARVLIRQRAGADVGRWAAPPQRVRIGSGTTTAYVLVASRRG
jgi:hypothetical protein